MAGGTYASVAASTDSTSNAQISGTVTYTFTWNGGMMGLPPPDKVWVREVTGASWGTQYSVIPYSTVTGACDAGASATTTPNYNSVTGVLIGETSSNIKWVEKDSSSGTFTVTISPSASVSASAGSHY
jgi:hypothetical protein